jgi:hypothetical protein
MQDTRNQNTTPLLPTEENVPAMLMTAQAGTDVITASAQSRVVSQRLATRFKLPNITGGLGFPPLANGEITDRHQVGLSAENRNVLLRLAMIANLFIQLRMRRVPPRLPF